uniref:Uncharacterized protein n=1 Tax=Oryza meridionalis TaxID=40149 RepID=A0A0E0DC30_9ORYZ
MQRPAVGEREAVSTEQRSWLAGERWVGEPGPTSEAMQETGRRGRRRRRGHQAVGFMGKSRLAAQSQEKPPVAKPVSTRSAGKAVDPRGEGGEERLRTMGLAARRQSGGRPTFQSEKPMGTKGVGHGSVEGGDRKIRETADLTCGPKGISELSRSFSRL